MRGQESVIERMDWVTVLVYLGLVLFGWSAIYAANYDPVSPVPLFNLSYEPGKQLIWILSGIVLIIAVMIVEFRFFETVSYLFYGVFIVLLIAVLIFGTKISGARSWFDLGFYRFQPSEFTKIATALALARYIQDNNSTFDKLKDYLWIGGLVVLPVLLILQQPDAGTALIFGSFIIMLYREGINPLIPILGISFIIIFVLTLLIEDIYLYGAIVLAGFLVIILGTKSTRRIIIVISAMIVVSGSILSMDVILNNVLLPHQKKRIEVLIDPARDPKGVGWNVMQSKNAIGMGGLQGMGYLNGLLTKNDYVPEHTTDFIYCTVAEEHGFVGSFILIGLFGVFLLRIIRLAERQKSRFARAYGYSVVGIFFFHFLINIAMTVGLFPVVGIPLPFFSYGGSSLWSFTILLFILIKLDAHRMQILQR